jgi:AGZA family xanthine/uracil permease-like MFS transporter
MVAGMFIAAVFFSPVVAAIPAFATAPALILVGALMTQSIAKVKWDEYTDAFPAFVTMVATPLTFSIATGLSLGLISFTIVKVAVGRFREVSPLLWILTALFILRYIYLAAE